jgi:hypothetical protein
MNVQSRTSKTRDRSVNVAEGAGFGRDVVGTSVKRYDWKARIQRRWEVRGSLVDLERRQMFNRY